MDNNTISPRFRPRVNKLIPSSSTERNKVMINWWFPLKTDGVTQVIRTWNIKGGKSIPKRSDDKIKPAN